MSPIVVVAFGLTVYLVTLLIVDILRLWTFQREARDTLYRRWAEWQR